jgi:beta-lactamase regulating signal transducer with metallopeptidase domain
MAQLSYSFCMSMLHSLWQAGVLLLLYWMADKSLSKKFTPLQKKNLLFVSLGIQSVLWGFTFFIYYTNVENNLTDGTVTKAIYNILSAEVIHTITPWLFTTYLLVITYKMIRMVYQWHTFKVKFHAGLQKPSVDLKLFTALKADHFGIKRKVQLWLSTTVNTPLTFGFLKPVIVLPVALVNQLSLQQAETLILHELTHIKTNDYLLNWFLLVAENIFFFNPFILLICKKIRLEREKYCDINVMAFAYAPLSYAETLLQAQQLKQFRAQYQLAAVGKQQELLQRIKFFTNAENHISSKKNRLTFPLLSILTAVIFTTAILVQYSISKTPAPIAVNPSTVLQSTTATPSDEAIPSFVNTLIKDLTDEKLKEMSAAVKQQQPAIEKELKHLDPLIKDIQHSAIELAEDMGNNFITPVSIKENDATRQIVIKEEQSGSKNATVKVYTLAFINGKWVIQPEWKLAAQEMPPLADSLRNIIDTTTLIKPAPIAY